MLYYPTAFDPKQEKTKEDRFSELEELEFQVFRMQQNMKEISKHHDVLGIDETKENKWVIIYVSDDGNICKVMAHDCEKPYQGKWDFSIHAHYKNDFCVHIDDIRGKENLGFGSVCMRFLKEYTAERKNIRAISGAISKRDWGHVDRLEYFYKKHRFHVELEPEEKKGEIIWQPM
ncbi:hypothetical protein CR203_04740 [Salipaludibacillus neizhouensis]|uniref:GNAT family N-acetyltransferase n=1 Tax=Salipaludibacillus neizhouensis TaxID=885475 RepID=A0A3A9KCG7_9BACI|nr:hypothetical protein [Salipaludibacillus neizhouensis]RKL69338.1 hypothetical protein CR203_04740 [Salipaludibacillus neizhouensis]